MYFAVDPLDDADITSKLIALIEAKSHAYWTAVVDSAFDHGGSALACPGSREVLYSNDELDAMREVSPLLIPLVREDKDTLVEQLNAIVRHCAGRPMLSVVVAEKKAAELKPNWQKCVRVVSDDRQKLLLRFTDTRVLQDLPKILRPESWAALTHDLIAWWYVDRTGALASLPVIPVDAAPRYPLAIGKHEFKRLVDQGEPDAVIEAMFEQTQHALPTTRKAEFFERIQAVCEFAREREFDSFPDVVALASFDALSGQRGLENPKLNQLVTDRGWKRGEMGKALVELFD